jgi:hypothetical protein
MTREELGWDEVVESLYNFSRPELQRLAWEALLISDGPDRIASKPDEPKSTVWVQAYETSEGRDGFEIEAIDQ